MSATDPPTTEAIDERATDWLDDRMSGDERKAFEAELAADPDLAAEVEGLDTVVRTLRRLPGADAPPDFLRAVQSRLRRRSRGRYFGLQVRYRFPYEAVINGILLASLVVLYMMAMPAADITPTPMSPELLRRGSAMPAIGAAVLHHYGRVEVVSATDDGDEVVYDVVLPADRVAELEDELGLYPDLERLEVATASAAAGTKRVRVRATARAFP